MDACLYGRGKKQLCYKKKMYVLSGESVSHKKLILCMVVRFKKNKYIFTSAIRLVFGIFHKNQNS